MTDSRRLPDLEGIGRAMLADFEILHIRTVRQLARCNAGDLYERLCTITGTRHDICCYDVLRCAIEQARNPDLPPHERKWWYWSRLRKQEHAGRPS